MIDAGELSRAGDKYIGVKYSAMDCQAFIEKCLSDCGIKIDLAGSNAWYRKVMAEGWTGTPEECRKEYGKIPAGAFLFILKSDGKEPAKYRADGIGNASHIGMKTGRGKGAIHSSASAGKVCESTFKDKTIRGGWNRVGLWLKEIDYGTGEAAEMVKIIAKSENGGTIKLREKPSTSSGLYWNIVSGTEGTLNSEEGTWSNITIADAAGTARTGWMMSKFIQKAGGVTENAEVNEIIRALNEAEEALDVVEACASTMTRYAQTMREKIEAAVIAAGGRG